MKTSALIRVFVYAFIALFLTGVLVWGIGNNNMGFFSFNLFGGSGINYDDEDYNIGQGEISKEQVDQIQVNWTAGNVKVNVYDPKDENKTGIQISEDSDTTLEDDYEMRYKVEDGVLKIMFAKPNVKFQGIFKSLNKDLTIDIPVDHQIADVDIETVSADIEAQGLALPGQFKLTTVSGEIRTEQLTGDNLDVETVSGEIRCNESGMASVQMESVSGEITSSFKGDIPGSISVETVSGAITIGLPENDGFKVDYDKVSGDFDCDFNVKINKNMAMYKNGGSKIKLETVSGNMKILAI